MKRGPGVLALDRGTAGEDAAVRYLEGLGYRVLDRNFRTRFGEIDIVARDGGTTVFVEVKERERATHGAAEEYVRPAKMRRVVGAARLYAAVRGLSEAPIRFDVIAIGDVGRGEQLRHHKGAFDASR